MNCPECGQKMRVFGRTQETQYERTIHWCSGSNCHTVAIVYVTDPEALKNYGVPIEYGPGGPILLPRKQEGAQP